MTEAAASPLQGLRLILYVRKSSESSERQVQSIADQISWGRQMAAMYGFTIVGIPDEEKSARKPGIRPKFYQALQQIEAAEADGFLAWQINRLSRNPVDSGTLQWLLQSAVIKVIVTSERHYWPADNTLLLSIDTGMSTQYVRDLAMNTWRGTKAKIDQGWFPSTAPQGYLNDPHGIQGQRRIFVDKKRWDTIRQLWDLMLTGTYNPRQIVRIINATGFKTKLGKPLSYSGTYALLTNIFYTGQFMIRGQVYAGKHKPMITLTEFDRVQKMLGDKGRPRPQVREFAYTGLLHCGECGCAITAETKVRYLKTTATMTEYTYYRCTKTRGRCHQKTIRLEALESRFATILADLTIQPEFLSFVSRLLDRATQQNHARHRQRKQQLGRQLTSLEKELYNLQKTYTTGTLDDAFYQTEKASLKHQIATVEQSLTFSQSRQPDWVSLTENAFLFAAHALTTFQSASLHTKRELIASLATNYQLRDGVLSYELAPWFKLISEQREQLLQHYDQRLRTATFGTVQIRFASLCQLLRSWCHLTQQIRNSLAEATDPSKADPYVFIPRLEAPTTATGQPFLASWLTHQSRNPSLGDTQLRLNSRLSGRLSPDDVANLLADYRAGTSTRALASDYVVSATSVKVLLRRNGQVLRNRGHTPGLPDHQSGKSAAS